MEIKYVDRKPVLSKYYPYIVAWGQSMGSFGYYIESQVALAIETNAPKDATFYDDMNKEWHTASNTRPELVAELDDYIKGTRGGIIPHWFEHEEDLPDTLKTIYANG